MTNIMVPLLLDLRSEAFVTTCGTKVPSGLGQNGPRDPETRCASSPRGRRQQPEAAFEGPFWRPRKCSTVEVGNLVRTLRNLDLGDAGKVERGAVGVLESMSNGPYMPYLVRFPNGTFAFEEGEIEEVEGQQT